MLVVWSFFFAKHKNWLYAGIFGSLASATRVTGIVLFPALLAEYFFQVDLRKLYPIRYSLMPVFLIPLGLFTYIFFLYKTTGDPLIFAKNLDIYGGQRSSNIILFPQVYYRYIFKILPSMNSYWPTSFTILLEFFLSTIFFIISILSVFKLKLSYWVYLFGGFIFPTFAGSFSSMPRYILVLFPGFIFLSIYISKLSRAVQIATFALLFISLFIGSSLFFRGYFLS